MDSGSVISSLCVHTANVGSGIAGIACESVFHEYKTSIERQNTISSQRSPSRSEPANPNSTSTLTRSSSILQRSLSLLRPRSSRKEIIRSNTFTPPSRPFDPARAYSFDIHNEELETRDPQRREIEEKERGELKNEATSSSLALPAEKVHKPVRQSVLGKRPHTSSAVALPSTSPENTEQNNQKRTSLTRKASSLFSVYGRSAPSFFSDKSDKPLIQSSRQALGRNRLVKRSTSQNTDLQSRSNLGLGSYSFRRPATSHQRRIASEGHQPSLGATGGFEKPEIDFAATRPRSQTFNFSQTPSQPGQRQNVETKRSFTKLGGLVDSSVNRVSDITIIKMPSSSSKSTLKKSKSPAVTRSESDRETSSTATPTPGTPRRNVSAAQQRQVNGESESVQNSDSDAVLLSKTSSKRPAGGQKIKVMKVRRRTTGTAMSDHSNSSPTTQVAPRAVSYNTGTTNFRTPDTRTSSTRVVSDGSIRPSSSYTADHLFTNSSSSDHRSRVSSAQTSTLGGSETDGMLGYDERSDTMYDSIRTGATSMSLARSKPSQLEDMFYHGDVEDDLADIQQKLTDFSGLNDPRYIVREEDEQDDSDVDFEGTFSRASGSGREVSAFTSNTLPSRLHTNDAPRYLDSNVSTPSKSKGWDTHTMDWSESREDSLPTQRPSTMHGAQPHDRPSRPELRGVPPPHLRSHSVPLPLGKPGPPVNDVTKLDAWSLGGNGATEDWDTDFVFDDPIDATMDSMTSTDDGERPHPKVTVQVPTAILQTQSSVHGQFGQVKELTLLVEELRELHAYGSQRGLLSDPKTAEVWSEAEGIIHLADVDDDVPRPMSHPQLESPSLAAFDFDSTTEVDTWRLPDSSTAASPAQPTLPSTPRRRAESTISISASEHQAKHVLSHIQPSKTIPSIPTSPSTPGYAFDSPARPATATATTSAVEKKFPFDTASLRDLVSRAALIAKTLREVVWAFDHPQDTNMLGVDVATPVRSSSLTGGERQPPEFSKIFAERDVSVSSVRRSPLSLRNESAGQQGHGSPMKGVE